MRSGPWDVAIPLTISAMVKFPNSSDQRQIYSGETMGFGGAAVNCAIDVAAPQLLDRTGYSARIWQRPMDHKSSR